MTILGISIGTRCTGVCVLEDGVLKDANIHRFDDIWSETKLHVIINRYKRYVRRYGVTTIIIKMPPGNSHTKALCLVKKRIEQLAGRFYCDLSTITRKEVQATLEVATIDKMVECTLKAYPEFVNTYERQRRHRHSKFRKLHEAVLAAHIAHQRKQNVAGRPSIVP